MAEVVFTAAVEGDVDEAVLRRLLQFTGSGLGPVYGKRGKGVEFAQNVWDVQAAIQVSDSLRRTVDAIQGVRQVWSRS